MKRVKMKACDNVGGMKSGRMGVSTGALKVVWMTTPWLIVLGSVGLVHSASGSLVYSLCYCLVVVAIAAGLVAVFWWAKRQEAEK